MYSHLHLASASNKHNRSYLQNSLVPPVLWEIDKPKQLSRKVSWANDKPKQLPRKVSYNSKLFYDVQLDETYKLMYTPPGLANFFIRKWHPKFPDDNDIIPDFGYISVMPCRPDGREHPQECCRFKVTDDPEEDRPESIDNSTCQDYKQEAEDLYFIKSAIQKNCELYPTMGCTDGVPAVNRIPSNLAKDQELYSLWSQCEYFCSSEACRLRLTSSLFDGF